jgi:hypothetical protein
VCICTAIRYCVVAEAECNWYLSILIYSFFEKEIIYSFYRLTRGIDYQDLILKDDLLNDYSLLFSLLPVLISCYYRTCHAINRGTIS